MSSLQAALDAQRSAASEGFGLADLEAAFADVEDELVEAREDPTLGEVGDLLFAAVQVARHASVDPDEALRAAVGRFVRRMEHIDAAGVDFAAASGAERRALWAAAKAAVG